MNKLFQNILCTPIFKVNKFCKINKDEILCKDTTNWDCNITSDVFVKYFVDWFRSRNKHPQFVDDAFIIRFKENFKVTSNSRYSQTAHKCWVYKTVYLPLKPPLLPFSK